MGVTCTGPRYASGLPYAGSGAFIGSAVKSGELKVHNSADRPLAAIKDVVDLGDRGGGDLGSKVLKIFAKGNHHRIPGPSGEFKERTPGDMMSLDLAGSQGAHPGHSGILLGHPKQLDAGRFSKADFERLANLAEKGLISTEAVGKFIAQNLAIDGNSKALLDGDLPDDLSDFLDKIGKLGKRLKAKFFSDKTLIERLTGLAENDNLIGSAGEFGLLFAFLANRPGQDNEDDFVIRLEDVEQMMVHHRFPSGWEKWPKKATDWVHATIKIAKSARDAHN